jgi:hypothetical protein
VTPADPELAAGADDEPCEPELELLLPVPDEVEPEPVELDPVFAEPDELEPPDPDDVLPEDPEPEPDEVPAAPLVLVWLAAGRCRATAPATATPRIPAPAVAPRSRRRARSRATTADTVRASLVMMYAPFGRKADLISVGAADLAALGAASRFALSSAGGRRGRHDRGGPGCHLGLWSRAEGALGSGGAAAGAAP